MTLIELVPTLLIAKQPDLGSALIALQRSSRVLACGALLSALLSSMLLTGYATDAEAAETRARSAKKAPRAEANGGNPSFYEVFGKRYRVRSSSDGYRERGIASWYGDPFHGRPTSSGEMYDMNEMTAAHTTLPLPTWVEVTNLANGKRITVKVNDRGPFVGKRVIDLSYAAATALGIVRDGTARVEVRALPGPPPETTAGRRSNRGQTSTTRSSTPSASASASTATATATATAKATAPSAKERTKAPEPAGLQSAPPKSKAAEPAGPQSAPAKARPDSPRRAAVRPPSSAPSPTQSERLFAQAGKFTKRDDAAQLVDSLRAHGFMNAFVVTEDGRRKSSHRVRVGPLLDAAEVEQMSARLRDLGVKRSRSVVMP